MDAPTAIDTPPSAQAHADPAQAVPDSAADSIGSTGLALTAAAASAAGLSAAAISCSHYVLSTLILHSPSTIDPAVIFRHVAGTNASSPAAHALVRRRYAALHLFLAWSVMQFGRLLRRRRIAKLPPRTQWTPPPWSLLLRTTAIAWSSLEVAQIGAMFAFYVLGPPTLASATSVQPRNVVDMESLIPSTVKCDPDSVSDDECSICLGSLVEPDSPTAIHTQLNRSLEPSSSTSSQSAASEPNSPALGSLRPWIYHLLHTHITPDIDLDLDLDLDMDLLGQVFFPSSSSPTHVPPPAHPTTPLRAQDRIMYTICPTGKHPSHAACLQMYLQTQPTLTNYGAAKLGLRCPTCRTPIPTSGVPSSSHSSETSEPTYSRSESRLRVILTSIRSRAAHWMTHTRGLVLAFLRHALRACLVPSRWADLVRAYALNWPKRGAFRGLVASLCSLFVLVHFRVHARRSRAGSGAMAA